MLKAENARKKRAELVKAYSPTIENFCCSAVIRGFKGHSLPGQGKWPSRGCLSRPISPLNRFQRSLSPTTYTVPSGLHCRWSDLLWHQNRVQLEHVNALRKKPRRRQLSPAARSRRCPKPGLLGDLVTFEVTWPILARAERLRPALWAPETPRLVIDASRRERYRLGGLAKKKKLELTRPTFSFLLSGKTRVWISHSRLQVVDLSAGEDERSAVLVVYLLRSAVPCRGGDAVGQLPRCPAEQTSVLQYRPEPGRESLRSGRSQFFAFWRFRRFALMLLVWVMIKNSKDFHIYLTQGVVTEINFTTPYLHRDVIASSTSERWCTGRSLSPTKANTCTDAHSHACARTHTHTHHGTYTQTQSRTNN